MIDRTTALKSVGLSETESQTYLDLREHGESQTGKICNRTNIPSSHIYAILTNLLEKGLVSYKIINNIRVYSASEPDAIAHLFEEKELQIKNEKKQLINFISQLKASPSELQKLSDFKYFYGIRGIKSMFLELINSWENGGEYYVASAPAEAFKKLEGFFIDVVFKKKKADKVSLKILVNNDSKEYGLRRRKELRTKVKFLNINTNTEYIISGDLLLLINYSSNPYGLMIKDKNFASTYKTFFDLLWSQAED
ncbi:hypothetical protein HN419_04560 [Candidatus Woesearchaeota archaeon]|nr:hypothetical protein [Candidatus Woesearchaeota archaeon]MBT3537852.1 hypothetical protein [Candidatus Woesearchaeota archaeon]MBT4697983.1 hypothetical protein [Candidatus Woesearchaeota archaeon]MBT7105521.1 hypothetical protein [Candidatus Woesearchaeota archaeon]MBT7931711.1 hypothetical protein [Candidatus Woesearchaeota archaeon]